MFTIFWYSAKCYRFNLMPTYLCPLRKERILFFLGGIFILVLIHVRPLKYKKKKKKVIGFKVLLWFLLWYLFLFHQGRKQHWILNITVWSITTNSLLHTNLEVSQALLPLSTNKTSSVHFFTHTCVQWSRTPGCSPSLRKPRRRRISPIYLHVASGETSCLAKQTFEIELVYLAG